MLAKTAKNILKKSFQNTKNLVNIARKGYTIDLSKEAANEMEEHMIEAAKKIVGEERWASSNGRITLTAEEALKARYSNSSINNGANSLLGDMAQIGAVAAAGVVGLKVTQGAVGLASGDW